MPDKKDQRLFSETIVPAKAGSGKLFDVSYDARGGAAVECLGMTFANDGERRAYFLERLREKLQDPEFRKIEGFPIGTDEDILALSDPPYYTACPNPWIADFIRHYGKPYDPTSSYLSAPYADELSASRNNPFINAHSYATKVPHEIIARLILHYTDPGDLVLDAFGGTGMTAVAGQSCGNRETLDSMGLTETENGGMKGSDAHLFRAAGNRRVILGDLSPAATFLAANFNLPINRGEFESNVKDIVKAVEEECGWMYETAHTSNATGRISCTLWSDVFVCPECGGEIVFWDAAIDMDAGSIADLVSCPLCNAKAKKNKLERAWVTRYDQSLALPVRQFRQVPVLILYDYGGRRYEKKPDDRDLALLSKIEQTDLHYWFPTDRMPIGEESRRNDDIGLTHVHHFFTRRNLAALSCAWEHARSLRARFLLTSMMYKSSVLCSPLMSNFFADRRGEARGGWVGKERSGTLYCPSIHSEVAIWP